jgi:carboxynorspermidine decarboxylase
MSIDYSKIPSPAFVLEEELLLKNLELIKSVQERSGAGVILALKGFAMWRVFPLLRKYLKGATASSLHEARLIFEEMGVKAHTYSPAYLPNEFEEIMAYSSHITFNSIQQYEHYQSYLAKAKEPISAGLRVNPEYSEVEVDLYNPSAPGTRLGVQDVLLKDGLPKGIEGLHFHVLCESTSYELEKVLLAFEKRFGHLLADLKWVNFGGGHLMTRKDYDVEHLVTLLSAFRQKYPHLEVILEPGSAIAWQTGTLLSTVLDIVESHDVKTAILDVSFTAHMPDTLEMPYRPKITSATDPIEGKPTYRLGGVSCLAGDYMAEYSFNEPLQIGQQIILEDMIHYTMVKTTTFNGVKHPSICIWKKDQSLEIVKTFTYEDFKTRLS